ncbi:hypothetical protein [Marinobacter sp. V034]|uniref:hypothetical protein n=1 Tax=Marinobacter sp. V034 TaxID=3459610 RepID=UPI00404493C9
MGDNTGKESREDDHPKEAVRTGEQKTFRGKFRVSAARLKEIGKEGSRRMEALDADDIGKYSE